MEKRVRGRWEMKEEERQRGREVKGGREKMEERRKGKGEREEW